MVAFVEPLVNLLAQVKGIDETVLAGSALAGHHRAHQRAGAAGLKTPLRQESDQRINVGVGHALNLHGKAGSHGDLPAAVALRSLRDGTMLFRSDLAVLGDHADIEHIAVALVLEAAQSFHPLDLLGREFAACGNGSFYHIKRSAALQHTSIRKSESFQFILSQVPSLTPGTDQQQFLPFVIFRGGFLRFCQIEPLSAGQCGGRMGIDKAIPCRRPRPILPRGKGFQPSGHLVHQHAAGRRKRMDGRGERRRVGEVQGQEVFHFTAKGNPCHGNVRHLVHRASADDLEAQQPMAVHVGDQLGDEQIGIRIVMRLVVSDTNHRNHLEP